MNKLSVESPYDALIQVLRSRSIAKSAGIELAKLACTPLYPTMIKKASGSPSYAYLQGLLKDKIPVWHAVGDSTWNQFEGGMTPSGFNTIYTPAELRARFGTSPRSMDLSQYYGPNYSMSRNFFDRVSGESGVKINNQARISVSEGQMANYGNFGVLANPDDARVNGNVFIKPKSSIEPRKLYKSKHIHPFLTRDIKKGPVITGSNGKEYFNLPKLKGKMVYDPKRVSRSMARKLKANHAIPLNRRTKAMIRKIIRNSTDLRGETPLKIKAPKKIKLEVAVDPIKQELKRVTNLASRLRRGVGAGEDLASGALGRILRRVHV